MSSNSICAVFFMGIILFDPHFNPMSKSNIIMTILEMSKLSLGS